MTEALKIHGRRLSISHLDRVIYPEADVTKKELLDYYVQAADVMLPHLRDRLLHMHRYPEGVNGPRFWQKACQHRPDWMPTAPVWSEDKQANIDFCVIDELPALLWTVNIGSLELHTSLHLCRDLHAPTMLAFDLDLDPGEGVGLLECGEVALRLRDLFDGFGMRSLAKTSGSKGLQVYIPLNHEGIPYATTKPLARKVAELLEAQTPDRVIAHMARSLRAGKVLIDWSQNTEHKSMVCAYSVRARPRPTVSTPLRWAEIEAALDAADPGLLVFETQDVLERIAADGDLFADVLTLAQAPA
jgi:bifunctional non-homologous end joining protein LigD